ncbi:ras gtpase-activating protein [Anaeramoeba flamelloides]|uniref:Ras gtpase-activating protein n=1 Tax=Anaeramoeba flamelloides TaxID=1746091 RepID=A0AAV7Y9P2_9EUKA|nr:ras gtpase-activating protein [Anaeramoeba flamelloides]
MLISHKKIACRSTVKKPSLSVGLLFVLAKDSSSVNQNDVNSKYIFTRNNTRSLCLTQKKITHFHSTFCRNVLIELIRAMSQDKLLPTGFVLDQLLDNDKSNFESLQKYIKNENILSIWKSLIIYWKHCCLSNQDSITGITSIFSVILTKSSLKEFDKLNRHASLETEKEIKSIQQQKDLESKIQEQPKLKMMGGYVLISTKKKLLCREIFNNYGIKRLSKDKLKKEKRNKYANNLKFEDNYSDQFNIWRKVYLVLTSHQVFFYTKKKGKKIGSILLKNLIVNTRQNANKKNCSRIDQNNEKNKYRSQSFTIENTAGYQQKHQFENQQARTRQPLGIQSKGDLGNSINKNTPEEENLFLLSENNIYNSVIIKVQSQNEITQWISAILERKRILSNNLSYLSQKLSYKDPNNEILHNLLISKNISLVSAIIENFDTRVLKNNFESGDIIAKSLVIAFHSKGKVMRILRWMIYQETVNGKNNSRTLFRSSSLSAKLIPIFAHIIGKDFLNKSLSSTIAMTAKITTYLDVDEDKVGKQMAEKNKNAIQLLANEFLGKIILSAREMPYQFRLICRAMEKSARRVFPASSNQSINNFIFLRFFVPAIATPDAFGLMEKKDIDINLRRNLITISKIIQSVGNQSNGMTGTLSCFDTFIQQSSMRIMRYFEEICQINEIYQKNNDSKINILTKEQIEDSLSMLKNHIINNWEDIKDVLKYSDSRSDYSVFISDFIENLIKDPMKK